MERREEEGASRRRRRRREPSVHRSDAHDNRVATTRRPAPYEIRKPKEDLALSPVPITPISALSDVSFETWDNLVSAFPDVGDQQIPSGNDQVRENFLLLTYSKLMASKALQSIWVINRRRLTCIRLYQ